MQDFEGNPQLKSLTIDFLEDIIVTPTLLPSEHRASSQLLRILTKDDSSTQNKRNLNELLHSPVSHDEKKLMQFSIISGKRTLKNFFKKRAFKKRASIVPTVKRNDRVLPLS